MLDSLGVLGIGDERYMDPRSVHPNETSLHGVPPGSILRSGVRDLGDLLMSPFKRGVNVTVSAPNVGYIHGSQNREIPKGVYMNLPQNRRVHTFGHEEVKSPDRSLLAGDYLDIHRAVRINDAIQAVLNGERYEQNPFRGDDSLDTAELFATICDRQTSGIHTGSRWLSNFQTKESAMSWLTPDPEKNPGAEPANVLDYNKFAAPDAEWYRKMLRDAISKLIGKVR